MQLVSEATEIEKLFKHSSRSCNWRRSTIFCAGLALMVAFQGAPAHAAVTVPDETSFDRTITVNPSATEVTGSSYQTVTAALNYAKNTSLPAAQKTKIFIKNGTYREAGGITIGGSGNSTVNNTLLTIEGESKGGVTISGASVYSSGWTEVSGFPGVWQHSWTPNFRMQAYDLPHTPTGIIGQRMEMVFINGKRLDPVVLEKWNYTQGNGYEPKYAYAGWAGLGELKDNTFGVAELGTSGAGDTTDKITTPDGDRTLSEIYSATGNSHGYANSIFVKLPAGQNPNTSTTEVSDLDNNGASPGTGMFLSLQKGNTVFRNLRFVSFANAGHPADNPVVRLGYDNWSGTHVSYEKVRLQNIEVNSNANAGLGIRSTKNLSVENCVFKDNGQNGSSGSRAQNCQYIDSIWDGNNWRSDGFPSTYGWASANFKFYNSVDQTFLRCDFLNGYNNGLWFDGSNMRNTMEDCWAINNKGIGYYQEISPGPNLYKNCRAELNNVGIYVSNSRNVTIDGGQFINNRNFGVSIEGLRWDRTVSATGGPFQPDHATAGTTPRLTSDASSVDYHIVSGSVTIKNAYIATGMGLRSHLVGDAYSVSTEGYASQAEYETAFNNATTLSNNTYYYVNSDGGRAFRLGSIYYTLAQWTSLLDETGSSTSSTKYDMTPAYVIDNSSATGFSTVGSWSTVTPASDKEQYVYGANYLSTGGNTSDLRSATFTPTVAVAGDYLVEANWYAEWLLAKDVPFIVTYNGGTKTVLMQLRTYGTQSPIKDYRQLGVFPLATGTGGSLRIENKPVTPGDPGLSWTTSVRADVARFVKMPSTTRAGSRTATNLVSNPSFDAEGFDTQTPSGWSEWNNTDASYTSSAGGGKTGARYGVQNRASAYEVSTSQTKTGLTNGLYTMKAWIKGTGTLVTGEWAGMYVKNYGGSQRWVDVPRTSTWTQIELKDINVTNGSAEIGFYSKVAGGKWIQFDDVEFFKQ